MEEKTYLFALPGGHLSLEINPGGFDKVTEVITHLYGSSKVKSLGPFSAQYTFGGQNFIYYNEWNDPCLMACSEQGNLLLQKIFAAVTGQ